MTSINFVRVFCFLAMMVLVSGGKCPSGGGGGGGTPSTTASLTLTIKNYISGGSGIQCPATINWRFEPVSLTGSQGKTAAFSTTGNYGGSSSQIETSGGVPVYGCVYNDNQIGMAPGTWKIIASNGAWTAECQKQLNTTGFNTAEFTINQSGAANRHKEDLKS